MWIGTHHCSIRGQEEINARKCENHLTSMSSVTNHMPMYITRYEYRYFMCQNGGMVCGVELCSG